MHKRVILQMHVYEDCEQKMNHHMIEWDSGTQEIRIDQKMFPGDLKDFSNFVQVLKGSFGACGSACKEMNDAK